MVTDIDFRYSLRAEILKIRFVRSPAIFTLPPHGAKRTTVKISTLSPRDCRRDNLAVGVGVGGGGGQCYTLCRRAYGAPTECGGVYSIK